MGRRKISISYITEPRTRRVTFSKRMQGVMKKAYELSELCGCEVALVLINEDRIVQYATMELGEFMGKYNSMVNSGTSVERRTKADMIALIASKVADESLTGAATEETASQADAATEAGENGGGGDADSTSHGSMSIIQESEPENQNQVNSESYFYHAMQMGQQPHEYPEYPQDPRYPAGGNTLPLQGSSPGFHPRHAMLIQSPTNYHSPQNTTQQHHASSSALSPFLQPHLNPHLSTTRHANAQNTRGYRSQMQQARAQDAQFLQRGATTPRIGGVRGQYSPHVEGDLVFLNADRSVPQLPQRNYIPTHASSLSATDVCPSSSTSSGVNTFNAFAMQRGSISGDMTQRVGAPPTLREQQTMYHHHHHHQSQSHHHVQSPHQLLSNQGLPYMSPFAQQQPEYYNEAANERARLPYSQSAPTASSLFLLREETLTRPRTPTAPPPSERYQ